MIDHYDWPGGREAMLRFGPADGPVVVALLPLFEEANRTRTFVVTLLRVLAERGIASLLPDLPGQGESETSLEDVSLSNWSSAISSVESGLNRRRYALSLRSGALSDGSADFAGRWRFAPQSGAQLLRELGRTAALAAREGDEAVDLADIDRPGAPIEIAGNRLPRALLAGLRELCPGDDPSTRTVRLAADAMPADRHVEGMPLWRRAEPGNDPALAAMLADDVAHWIRTCEG